MKRSELDLIKEKEQKKLEIRINISLWWDRMCE